MVIVFLEREFGIIFNKEAEWWLKGEAGRWGSEASGGARNLVEPRNLIYGQGTLELEHMAILGSLNTTAFYPCVFIHVRLSLLKCLYIEEEKSLAVGCNLIFFRSKCFVLF